MIRTTERQQQQCKSLKLEKVSMKDNAPLDGQDLDEEEDDDDI